MTTPDDAQWRRPTSPAGQGIPPGTPAGYGAPSDQSSPPGTPAGMPTGSGTPAGAPAGAPDIPWRPGYPGPPLSTPPPLDWQPEVVVRPAPPRSLPRQDHGGIDAQESSARTVTYGVGLVAGAILLVVLCALCGRALL